MSKAAATIDAAGHCFEENPSWLRLMILSKALIDGVELLLLPRKLLTVVQAINRLVLEQIGDTREAREFACVLSQPFIDNKARQIFSVKVLTGRSFRLEEHRVMLHAEAGPSPDKEALPAVVNAVPAAKQFVHG
jgi:hypothetical protein